MQFSFTTIFTLLAGATIVHAGVIDVLSGRQITEGCQYIKENYLSTCKAGEGDTVYCEGNDNACRAYGKTDGFDETATKLNEEACAGKQQAASCMQTIQCCP